MQKVCLFSSKNGFSLIEVLITLMILSVGISAITALMTGNIRTTVNAKNQIIASELAQEGIEMVRNIRESNIVAGRDSFTNLMHTTTINQTLCRIDYDDDVLTWKIDDAANCNQGAAGLGAGNYRLYLKNGFYSHDSTGSSTKFARRMVFSQQDENGDPDTSANPYRILVRSIVSWDDQFPEVIGSCTIANKCTYIDSILTKWE
ncbi:MAG: hypothetical protein ACD_9C00051G0003 [uncultured bacterium]|nr:MAG: hypothetical protein ACD_9C00051G0003 [uncultured bacterium]